MISIDQLAAQTPKYTISNVMSLKISMKKLIDEKIQIYQKEEIK
jgi:hypothetical protein